MYKLLNNKENNFEYHLGENLFDSVSFNTWMKNKGGILRKKCHKCGGIIVDSGKGVIREKCSKCGIIHNDRKIG